MGKDKLAIIKERIRLHEGWRSKPYRDIKGILTIGYGFNVARPLDREEWGIILPNGLTKEQGEEWLSTVLRRVLLDAMQIPEFTQLDATRQVALIDMVYHMGYKGVMKFKKMRAAIAEGDFKEAARQIMDSQYGRGFARRASENARIVEEGKLDHIERR